jgi:arylsulfatase A-like enzyme
MNGFACLRQGLLGFAALLAACAPRAAAPPEPPRPTRGYILISVDTLRADALGVYGAARPTTPFLDRLAERATIFENAFVQVPATLPSHMSIFTGLYPGEHDVVPPKTVLAASIPTLPELFRAAGFRTFGHSEGDG